MLVSHSRKLAAAAGTMLLLVASGAGAQTVATTPEATSVVDAVTRHHQAVQAAVMCENRRLTIDQEVRIAELIAAQTVEIPAGTELKVLNDARDFMRARISSMGCGEALVRDRLNYFHTSIAPGIGS